MVPLRTGKVTLATDTAAFAERRSVRELSPHLLDILVPFDAVADLRAQAPCQRLGMRLDGVQKPCGLLAHPVPIRLADGGQGASERADFGDVHACCPP